MKVKLKSGKIVDDHHWIYPIYYIKLLDRMINTIPDTEKTLKQNLRNRLSSFVKLISIKSWDVIEQEVPRVYAELVEKKSTRDKLIEWADEIKQREPFCMVCGSIKELHAHHMFYKSKLEGFQFNIDNGITLCRKHHAELHLGEKGYDLLK